MHSSTKPNLLLIEACGLGDIKSARQALAAGADAFFARDLSGASALMLAAHASAPKLVELLIPISDLRHADEELWDALRCALDAESAQCAELLLRAGADPLRPDARGTSVSSLLGDKLSYGQAWSAVRSECQRREVAVLEKKMLNDSTKIPAASPKNSRAL